MRRLNRARRSVAASVLAAGFLASAVAFPAAAGAHALVGKKDLPIPEWLFAWGASLVLIVSFIGLTVAWRKARFEDDRWRPVSAALSRALVNRGTEIVAGAIGTVLLGVVVWAGLTGTEAPDRNFSLTFVFVTIWLCVAALSVLLGDFFRAFNPWRAIGRASGALFRLLAGQAAQTPLRYPPKLGRWPAVGAIFGFVWLELAYATGGPGVVGLTPRVVAIAALIYTVYTLAMMALYGVEEWCDEGEGFSVYFSMFASLAPLEVREGQLGRRPFLSGTTSWMVSPGSVALVLLTIGATTYDGATEGTLAEPIRTVTDALLDAGINSGLAFRLSGTIFLLGAIGFVSCLFWGGVAGMHMVRGTYSTAVLGRLFAHAFIPIALAYLVAHYFTLVLYQEQAQFTYLLTDPLGGGATLIGETTLSINYGVIGATAVWYVQVAALVVGHVIALILGHDRAVAIYSDPRSAARSQYWMLALMVAFTCTGLFLLSQANA